MSATDFTPRVAGVLFSEAQFDVFGLSREKQVELLNRTMAKSNSNTAVVPVTISDTVTEYLYAFRVLLPSQRNVGITPEDAAWFKNTALYREHKHELGKITTGAMHWPDYLPQPEWVQQDAKALRLKQAIAELQEFAGA